MEVFKRVQTIDRRITYIILAVVVVIPMFVKMHMPTAVTQQVEGVYDAVQAIPPSKIAILSGDWESGTMAENLPQTEVLMRHLFQRNIRFAILPFAPQTTTLMEDTAERLAKEYHKRYGVDWVNWGFRVVPMFTFLKSLAKDVPGTVGHDYQGTPLSKLPVMRGIKTIQDIGFVAQITPTGSLGVWISFIQSVYGTPLAYAPTGVMVPQGYNPLDAKQIVGMLPGLVGAAQYEELLHHPGNGLHWSNSLSFAEMLMVVLIALANIGYFVTKNRDRSEK